MTIEVVNEGTTHTLIDAQSRLIVADCLDKEIAYHLAKTINSFAELQVEIEKGNYARRARPTP